MSAATLTPDAAKTGAKPAIPLAAQPYLSFEGRCEEALNFYRDTLGAQIKMMVRFSEAPKGAEGCGEGPTPAPPADKIMHASFRIGTSDLYATDGRCQPPAGGLFKGVSLSIPFTDIAVAEQAFNALAVGGMPFMPLAETFFAKKFGMVADRFGLVWMVIVEKPM